AQMLVIVTVALGFYNVVARYIGRSLGMNLSSNLFLEMQWHLFSLVFFFGFAYILKHGVNVRVDFIYGKWSKYSKALLDFWGHLLLLVPFCVLGIYVTIRPVLTSWGRLSNGTWSTWELSPDPNGIPRAPIKTMIIVAFVLLLLQVISELIKLWAVLRGQELDVEELHDDVAPIRIE
ncbi:MAG: TRAP transporter small permease subunit, partial [Caldilineaceae bacterium]|nr:TRAP transporter small permease subunit [Caldilineaceae bacterium]